MARQDDRSSSPLTDSYEGSPSHSQQSHYSPADATPVAAKAKGKRGYADTPGVVRRSKRARRQ